MHPVTKYFSMLGLSLKIPIMIKDERAKMLMPILIRTWLLLFEPNILMLSLRKP